MNISDYISESLETIFFVKILFDADPDPLSGNPFDLESGFRDGRNSDPGINIPDPQHWAQVMNVRFAVCSFYHTYLLNLE